jgi:molybdopterin synthase sulfur carrier subunit
VPLTIKFIGALRHLSGKTQFTITFQEDITIKELVNEISQELPELKHTFSDQQLNDSRSNSLVLVNGREISVLNGYETRLKDGDEIVFVPVVHGG